MHDPDRFGEELTAETPKLARYARSLTHDADEAADLVQETLLRGWRARESFAAGTNLSAWLARIMRNRFLTELRVRGRYVRDPDSVLAEAVHVDPAQEHAALLGQLRLALQRLPPGYREALALIADGESYGEAAETLGAAEGTLKSRVSRARHALGDDFMPWRPYRAPHVAA